MKAWIIALATVCLLTLCVGDASARGRRGGGCASYGSHYSGWSYSPGYHSSYHSGYYSAPRTYYYSPGYYSYPSYSYSRGWGGYHFGW